VPASSTELLTYAARLVELAGTLTQLVTQLEDRRAQLREIWPEGTASDRSSETTATALSTFLQSIQPIVGAAQTITTSAQAIQSAQGGLTGVLSAVNPVVQSLLSSPWGHGAGRALAYSTVGSLSGFLSGVGSLLGVLGDKDLGTLLTGLGTLASGVDQMVTALGGTEAGTADAAAAAYAAGGYAYPDGGYGQYASAVGNPYATTQLADTPYAGGSYAGQYPVGQYAGQYAGGPYAGQYAGGPYAGQYAGGPYAGQYAGGPYANPYTGGQYAPGSSADPGRAAAGLAGGAGAGVGDWVPVDAPGAAADPAATATTADGAAGTDARDTATEVRVSSGGETVSFSIDADQTTTVTAEVGPGDGTEVVISVRPDRA
jgi:hypothetical protein